MREPVSPPGYIKEEDARDGADGSLKACTVIPSEETQICSHCFSFLSAFFLTFRALILPDALKGRGSLSPHYFIDVFSIIHIA